MRQRILIDTGPLVAILSRSDSWHRICVDSLKELAPPLLTCLPVMTEACWLLRSHPVAVKKLLDSFESGLLKLLPLDEEDLSPIAEIMDRYRKLNAQFADAALVHLATREQIDTVFTLDIRDFAVYRHQKNKPFRLII